MRTHDPDTVRAIEPRYADIYAHAVETEMGGARQLHISGQLGIDVSGHLFPTFEDQLRQALRNVEALLESVGMTRAHIVKATYYLTRASDLPALSAIRSEVWGGVRPAVTTLVVAGLAGPDFLVEVEVLAQDEG